MYQRTITIFSFIFFINGYLCAQKPLQNIEVELQTQYLIMGEQNSSFDFLVGLQVHRFLASRSNSRPFITLGVATDIGQINGRFISTDLQIGKKWRWGDRTSIWASVGGIYINEALAHQLGEETLQWQNSILGPTGSMGISYNLLRKVDVQLSFKQADLKYSAVVLGLIYSFN